MFEIDDEGEKMIDDGDFIQIRDFHGINSDESFISPETKDTSSNDE